MIVPATLDDPMARAIALARSALGSTSPNPAVGAVIVGESGVVGEGFTLPPGQAHAEIGALQQAGPAAAGATLYCTLEPCCHYGRTPPCTDAIVGAGIARVVYAATDPNPRVSGGGAASLRAAGVDVEYRADPEAALLYEAFAKHVTTGLPFVVAKFAMSLVVVDSDARTPPTARMLRQPGRTLIATAGEPNSPRAAALQDAGAEVLSFPGTDGRVNLSGLLEHLGQQGMVSVMVEGGGGVLGALLDARLIDKFAVFLGPMLIGGAAARSPIEGNGATTMADVLRLDRVNAESIGPDWLVTGYPAKGGD